MAAHCSRRSIVSSTFATSLGTYPFLKDWCFVGHHLTQQVFRLVRDKQHLSVFLLHEALRQSVVKEREQMVKVTRHVDQTTGLYAKSKLSPREHFSDLYLVTAKGITAIISIVAIILNAFKPETGPTAAYGQPCVQLGLRWQVGP